MSDECRKDVRWKKEDGRWKMEEDSAFVHLGRKLA